MDQLKAGFETARLALARVRVDGRKQCTDSAQQAARVCAQALDVERVGVWLLEDEGKTLRCWAQYTKSTDAITRGATIETASCPAYFRAMAERRAIIADDARTNPATAELTEHYLVPLGITSMLDAPLYREGHVAGVVCHEHVGPMRHWTEREVDFASSVADLVAAIFEQALRREAETALRDRTARLTSLSQLEELARLSRSIAHDFNNVLAGIDLIAQQLERQGSPWVVARGGDLAALVAVGTRLCRQLSQKRADDAPHTRVDQALEELRPLLETLTREAGSLAIEKAAPDCDVAVPRTHFEQILLNLCVNARDALAPGGSILVSVRAATADEGGERFVVIDVSDDGEGMAPEVAARAFEPYFTTRPRGSGLGLATVHELVSESGGTVRVQSARGRGSLFTVVLPRAVRAEPAAER